MLKYVDRKNTDCSKWDNLESVFGADGLLPFWVADMDFRVDEHIIRAMHDYVEAGVPGYYKVPDSYYQAFIDWEKNEHGQTVDRVSHRTAGVDRSGRRRADLNTGILSFQSCHQK